jgi:Xaa-Pro aminopeptidase
LIAVSAAFVIGGVIIIRRGQVGFVTPSFETISSSGANGAIIHYKPPDVGSKPITAHEIHLLDSGGQYRDGTTDVTRTMHFGTPSTHEKRCYTRVMQVVQYTNNPYTNIHTEYSLNVP